MLHLKAYTDADTSHTHRTRPIIRQTITRQFYVGHTALSLSLSSSGQQRLSYYFPPAALLLCGPIQLFFPLPLGGPGPLRNRYLMRLRAVYSFALYTTLNGHIVVYVFYLYILVYRRFTIWVSSNKFYSNACHKFETTTVIVKWSVYLTQKENYIIFLMMKRVLQFFREAVTHPSGPLG